MLANSYSKEWAANLKIIQSSWLTQDKTTKIWLLSLLLNLILEIRRYNVKDITRNLCDIINAINWLPKESGLLWAGKLGNATCGSLGTISSLILLNEVIYNQL